MTDNTNHSRQRGERAQEELSAASTEAQRAAASMSDEVKQSAEDLKEQAFGAAEGQRQSLSSSVSRIAKELEQSASNCQGDDQWAEQVLNSGASLLRGLASELNDNGVQDIVRHTQDYGRSHPAGFLGGSLAAGFLAARLGKAGLERATDHHDGSRDTDRRSPISGSDNDFGRVPASSAPGGTATTTSPSGY